MGKRALVTGGTKNMLPSMAVLALNVRDVCPNIADELVIYHDGIPKNQQKKIQRIFPTRFIEYVSPFTDTSEFKDVVTNYFSIMVFCKYECFKLLDDYDVVVWSDYDVVILKDISHLLDFDEPCFIFETSPIKNMFQNNMRFDKYPQFDFEKGGVFCGIFGTKRTGWDYKSFYNDCIEYTGRLAEFLYLPEEAIISLMLQKHNINYKAYNTTNYSQHPKELVTDDTFIIHAYGQPKFWNYNDSEKAVYRNERWEQYYSVWINKMRGQRFYCRPSIFVKTLLFFKSYALKCKNMILHTLKYFYGKLTKTKN